MMIKGIVIPAPLALPVFETMASPEIMGWHWGFDKGVLWVTFKWLF